MKIERTPEQWAVWRRETAMAIAEGETWSDDYSEEQNILLNEAYYQLSRGREPQPIKAWGAMTARERQQVEAEDAEHRRRQARACRDYRRDREEAYSAADETIRRLVTPPTIWNAPVATLLMAREAWRDPHARVQRQRLGKRIQEVGLDQAFAELKAG